MTNRIVGGQSSQLSTDYYSGAYVDEANGPSASQKSEGAESTARPVLDGDVWEEARDPFPEFVGATAPETGATESDVGGRNGICVDEPMAVWEMISPAAPAAVPGAVVVGSVDMNDNAAARQIARAIEQFAGRIPTDREVRTEFSVSVLQKLSHSEWQDLIALAADPQALRAHLLERGASPNLADKFVEAMKNQVVALAGERIAALARPAVAEAARGLEQLNASPESRRVFLATVAMNAGGKEEIAAALVKFGLTQSSASSMAEKLDVLRGDPDGMRAFLNNEPGARGTLALRGEYAGLERDLEKSLNSMQKGLESIEKSLTVDQIRHDKFMTSPIAAQARDQVMWEMGATPGSGLDDFFKGATAASTSSQQNERILAGVVMVTGAVALSTATVGLGGVAAVAIGATTATAGVLPGLAVAYQDVSRAQGAVGAGLGGAELVKMAERDRNVAYALAVASVVIGGSGKDLAIVTLEAIGVVADL